MDTTQTPGRLSVGIISAGRVGAALGSALRAAGHTIVGAHASSEESRERLDTMLHGVPNRSVESIVRESEVVLFAVPDDELQGLVDALSMQDLFRPGQLVIHVAGRYGIGVLSSAQAAGALTMAIHPAMTFSGTSLDVARLAGCPFAITTSSLLRPIAEALVTELGGVAVHVEEEDRGLYHAALAHAANHAVTLVAQSMRMLEAVGIEEPGMYLAPLVEASVEGALRRGDNALTGPVVRGDIGTVKEHLDALAALHFAGKYEDVPPTYVAMACATAERVLEKSLGNEEEVKRILDLLHGKM